MAIKSELILITLDEFKNSNFYDEALFDNEATSDKNINLAIEMASSNIDYFSGFSIGKKWPEDAEESKDEWVTKIKLSAAHYVRYALTKGVDYIRGQQSLSVAGFSESINNPDDPLFVPNEVFNYLRKAGEYVSFKGYNLKNVESKRYKNIFSKFSSNCGEDSPLNQFLKIVNLFGTDGIIIDITNPSNILGPVVTISFDKSLIPDVKGFETKEEHNKDVTFLKENKADSVWVSGNFELKQDHKFDVDNLQDTKQDTLTAGENITITADNVISSTGGGGESLWEINPDSPNYVRLKNGKIISATNKKIVSLKGPDISSDATNKQYVDDKLAKKQDMLTAGTGINIDDNNVISATGGGGEEWELFQNLPAPRAHESNENRTVNQTSGVIPGVGKYKMIFNYANINLNNSTIDNNFVSHEEVFEIQKTNTATILKYFSENSPIGKDKFKWTFILRIFMDKFELSNTIQGFGDWETILMITDIYKLKE